jgi:YVTN family beta-propeller protein
MRAAAALALLLGVVGWQAGREQTGSAGPSPRWTQSILDLWAPRGLLFVAYQDAGLVVALDVRTGARVWESPVGRSPRRLSLIERPGHPAELFVSCEGSGEVWLLDPATGATRRRLAVGPTPSGFAVVGGRTLFTALRAVHQVSVWDLETGRERARVPVHPFPVAMAAAGREVYVAHFFDGHLTVLDPASFQPTGSIEGDRAINQPAGLLPFAGGRLLVPHILSNDDRASLHFANAVFPAVSVVDAPGRRYLPERRLGLAFIDRPVNGPEALAVYRGDTALVSVNSRSNDLSLVDLRTSLAMGHVEVGRYPLGIAIDPSGARAFVANANEHTVSVVDLGTLREVTRWPYGQEVLPPQVARGRDLFDDADSPRMALNQWLSCSNCHPDGGSDGRAWTRPGKPRLRTKDLHGLADTLPAGWLASQDEMQDEELLIRSFLRGTGLSPKPPNPLLGVPNAGLSTDLDALAAYVYSLRFEPSPWLENGRLSASARRGRHLFRSPALGCAGCHPPPAYTVSAPGPDRRVAGVLDPEPSPVPPLDVPSLRGLYAQPRLLHDGRASTPEEVLTRWNGAGRHGHTSGLTAGQLRDLESFLLSLPYATAGSPSPRPRTPWRSRPAPSAGCRGRG